MSVRCAVSVHEVSLPRVLLPLRWGRAFPVPTRSWWDQLTVAAGFVLLGVAVAPPALFVLVAWGASTP